MPDVELFRVSLEGCLCESSLNTDSLFDTFNDAIEFIW